MAADARPFPFPEQPAPINHLSSAHTRRLSPESAGLTLERLRAQVFEANDAGLQELAQEYARRHGYEMEPDAMGKTIN